MAGTAASAVLTLAREPRAPLAARPAPEAPGVETGVRLAAPVTAGVAQAVLRLPEEAVVAAVEELIWRSAA
jgi:hypothetical protein